MKKKLFSTGLIAVLCLTSVFAMTACGDKQPYSDYDLSEYVTVGDYKGLEYKKVEASVSDEEVDKEIQSRLKAKAVKEDVKKGTVEDGDTVNIDYEGKMDGKTFDGGSAEGYSLTIGSGTFIDGFESGLIGKKIGDTVTLDLEFPEDYGKQDGKVTDEKKAEMAGKPVTFEVKINSKSVEKVPAYNMEFVEKYYSDYDSLEAFEKSVKEDLMKTAEDKADSSMKTELWEQVIENSKKKKIPEEEKKARIEKERASLEQTAKDYGIEWEDYLEAIGYTEEEMDETIETYAENSIYQEMIAYSIAETEGIEVTDDEYDEYLDKLLKEAGMDRDSYKSANDGKTIEEWGEENNIRFSVLLNKIMDKVMEYGKQVK